MASQHGAMEMSNPGIATPAGAAPMTGLGLLERGIALAGALTPSVTLGSPATGFEEPWKGIALAGEGGAAVARETPVLKVGREATVVLLCTSTNRQKISPSGISSSEFTSGMTSYETAAVLCQPERL